MSVVRDPLLPALPTSPTGTTRWAFLPAVPCTSVLMLVVLLLTVSVTFWPNDGSRVTWVSALDERVTAAAQARPPSPHGLPVRTSRPTGLSERPAASHLLAGLPRPHLAAADPSQRDLQPLSTALCLAASTTLGMLLALRPRPHRGACTPMPMAFASLAGGRLGAPPRGASSGHRLARLHTLPLAAHAANQDPPETGVVLPAPRPQPVPISAAPAATLEPLLLPQSPLGRHLLETAARAPRLFCKAVRNALHRLNETEATLLETHTPVLDDVELYNRIRQIRALDRAQALEDIMYLDVLFSFHSAGVKMLTPQYLEDPSGVTVAPHQRPGTAVFSPDAVELIDARMPCLLGMLGVPPSSTPLAPLYTCKYHVAQLYAGSALFGYFLRRADKRFALAKSAGFVSPILTFDETVTLLSDLYLSANADFGELDRAAPLQSPPKPRGRSVTLKEHLETLHPEITTQMMQMSSLEAAHVLQNHTKALLGDLEALQQQLLAVLQDPGSPSEANLLSRLRSAVQDRRVDVVQLQEGDHRWLVLEAINFGAHLRDAEDEVKAVQQCPLLTPNRTDSGPEPCDSGDGGSAGGRGGGGGSGGGGGPPAPPPPGPGGSSAAMR